MAEEEGAEEAVAEEEGKEAREEAGEEELGEGEGDEANGKGELCLSIFIAFMQQIIVLVKFVRTLKKN